MKIYLRTEHSKNATALDLAETDKVSDILQTIPGNNNGEKGYNVYLEDSSGKCNPDHSLAEGGIKPLSRVHCHRCDDVKVFIVYNNIKKHVDVPPSYTGEAIMGYVPALFGITESDAADLQLKITDGGIIEKADHIGSFVSWPHCKIELQLIPKVNVQG